MNDHRDSMTEEEIAVKSNALVKDAVDDATCNDLRGVIMAME